MLKKNGFTMLELLVVLAIMSMMIAMSIPAFSSHIRGTRMRTAAREISTAIMSARTQAITLRENRAVFFGRAKGDFGIVGDEEGWSFPPGVELIEAAFLIYGITLTPMGKVCGFSSDIEITIFSDEDGDGNWDDIDGNGVQDPGDEAKITITVGALGHVVIE